MAKLDRKKIIYAILSELNEGNKTFKCDDFGVSHDIYFDIINAIINNNLAQGFKIVTGKDLGVVFSGDAYITVPGIEFLEQNSTWGKAYAGLKEFKSWIPGIGG